MTPPHRPDPPPMKTDDVKIAAAGTAAWAVALVVLLVVGLPSDDRWWLWVCVAGMAIGLFGMWYAPRLQASRARKEAAHAERHGAADPDDAQAPSERDAAERGATGRDAVG